MRLGLQSFDIVGWEKTWEVECRFSGKMVAVVQTETYPYEHRCDLSTTLDLSPKDMQSSR